MKKKNFIVYFCLALMFSVAFSCFSTIINSNAVSLAEEINYKQGIPTINSNSYEAISYGQLINMYEDKTNYYKSDVDLPEYYTMIEGSGTKMNSKYLSEDDDVYMLYAPDQNPNGLCWAFNGNQVATTTILKETGEYIDFSESWIAAVTTSADSTEGKDNLVSELLRNFIDYDLHQYPACGGANFMVYDLIARNYGLVLEQDYNHGKSFLLSQDDDSYGSNAPYLFEYYSQFATKTALENIISIKIQNPQYISTSEGKLQSINSIKKHLLRDGALVTNFYMGTYVKDSSGEIIGQQLGLTETADVSEYNSNVYLKDPDTYNQDTYRGAHAVTLIGWDDTYNGGEGAWIALNSWGEDDFHGTIYIEYDDTDMYDTYFWGYEYNPESYKSKYVESNDSLVYTDEISSSNAVGAKAPSGVNTDQKNIFYQQDDVRLEYKYTFSQDAEIDSIELYYQNQLLDKNFISHNESQKIFSIAIKNAKLGSYKIAINYSNKVHFNTFIVTNGLETGPFGYCELVPTLQAGYYYINNSIYTVYSSYSLGEDISITVPVTQESGELSFSLDKSSYSAVKYLSYNGKCYEMFANNNNYIFSINYNLNGGNLITYELYLKDEQLKYERPLVINIIKKTSFQKSVFVEYDLNGGVNNSQNLDIISVNQTGNTEIQEPTRTGYNFKGWFYDSLFEQPLTYSNSKYYLDDFSKINVSGDNRYSSMVGHEPEVYTLCLYAKWEKITYTITFNTNGGSEISDLIVDENGKITRPMDPTKKGYVFKGWFSDSECINEFDFDNTLATSNLTIYAKWEKSAFVVIFNTNGGSEIEEIYVEQNAIITPPTNPTKNGFDFVGWYQDEQLTQLFDFKTQIVSDITLYAQWETAKPTEVEISSEAWQITGKEFIINLKFNHELKNDELFTYVVKWYRSDKPDIYFPESTSLQIKDTVTVSGRYEYRAEVVAIYNGNKSQKEISNTIEVFVVDPIDALDNIVYNGKGIVSWEDDNDVVDYFGTIYYAKYRVTLYQRVGNKDFSIKSIEVNSELNEKSFNFYEYLTKASAYRVGIIKTIGNASELEQYSVYFKIAEIVYACDTDEISIQKEYYDINSQVLEPASLTKTGYTFDGWYYDENFEDKVEFPFNITKCEKITMNAKWQLNNLICEVEGDLSNLIYDKQAHQINMKASHELNYISFEYKWYKYIDGNYEEIENKTNIFEVSVVSDSGDYLCNIIASDKVGRTNVKEVYFNVNIARAETEIIVEEITKKYVYNGNNQTIDVVATLSRGSEEPVEIQVTNNKFKDVPVDGYLDVVVFAPESDNYCSAQISVRVPINKALSTLFIENQKFTYNGKKVIPVGIISNEEQKDKIFFEGEDIINVGTYYRKAIVQETVNYLAIEKDVHIQVVPAVVQIKAKDTTSLWLLGKKKFEYEIVEGQIFGDDDLNIEFICDVNIMSPRTYSISITASNDNYYIGIVEGQYKVSMIPHIIILLTLILIGIFMILRHNMQPYIVEFEGDGVLLTNTIAKSKNNLKIKNAEREGYLFDGWYSDPALTVKFNGKLVRGKTKTLYAKWIKVDVQKPEKLRAKDIAQSIVNNLFANKKQQEVKEEPVEEVVEVKEANENINNTDSSMDFINNIIKKATDETNASANEEELKKLIDRLSRK